MQTIEAAMRLAPDFKQAGYKTFFVPQGEKGDVNDLIYAFEYASRHPDLIDYIGVSILSAPLAYDVESGNTLQRFVSRLRLMYELSQTDHLDRIKDNGQKIHFLGMVDGPNEIMYMNPFGKYIDTWDSSAAVWLGLDGQYFDQTPTGRREGKFEKEVDFNYKCTNPEYLHVAVSNIAYIDGLVNKYL
jgi:hypothetical protein